MQRICTLFLLSVGLSMSLSLVNLYGQDLEPGFLSETPLGSNILIGAYGHSRGEVLLDNTLPIEDLNARMHILTAGYFRSFKLFNKLAKFDLVVPYAFGDYEGLLEGNQREARRNGFGDPLARLSVIFIGSGALNPKDFFQREERKFKMGASLRMTIPLGQYNPENLINLGGNRWAVKGALAASYTFFKRLVIESHVTAWLFAENPNYFGGNRTKQDPLFGIQFHATYIFKPGIWLAGSLGAVRGGTIYVNGEPRAEQRNNRFGVAFAYRLNRQHSLKAAYTNALLTTTGADFNTMVLAYQFFWLDRKYRPKREEGSKPHEGPNPRQ